MIVILHLTMRCLRIVVTLLVLTALADHASAQVGRLDYRVVFAAPYQLQQVLDAAGRDGFTCVSVARPELDVRLPGVAVIMARPFIETTHVNQTVPHRVVRVAGSGGALAESLERGAAEGYRLCGVALADVAPGAGLVAVMTPDTGPPPGGRHYAAAVTGNAERVAHLASLGRDGFVPIAATPIDDSQLPEQRHWMVVLEQTGTQPVDIVLRSAPGPDALGKAIAERAAQGFICSLLWKEGLTTMVAVMSKLPVDPARRPEFDVDTIDPSRINGLSGMYVADLPYLSDGQRVIVTIEDRSSTVYTVADPLPRLGSRDYASVSDLEPLGDHLGRDRSRDRARIVASSVRRGPGDSPMLHTVLVELRR